MPLDLTAEQERVMSVIDSYLREQLESSDEVVAVEGDGNDRLMMRLAGTAKDFTTIWFTVGDRTLRYESYFMPDPLENHEELYRYLLVRNASLYCCRFSLADDHDIFITGQLPLAAVSEDEIDRIVGSIYVYVESYFERAIRIGYPAHFRPKDQVEPVSGVADSP